MREKILDILTKGCQWHNVETPKMTRWIDQIIALTVGELKKEIEAKRANAFSVSLFGDREHQIKMDAMVNAYDVILELIKEMLK